MITRGLYNAAFSVATRHSRVLSILIYHRVLPERDPLRPHEPDQEAFATAMRRVRQYFNVLPLASAVDALEIGTLPPRALSITFDDGYADNATVAAPVLQELGLSATVFVAPGFLGRETMWNDKVLESVRRLPAGTLDLRDLGVGRYVIDDVASRRAAIVEIIDRIKHLPMAERQAVADDLARRVGGVPGDLMMDERQVRSLRGCGMAVGAHTVTHPILTRLTPDDASREIRDCKAQLEKLLSEPVTLFAYPNGKAARDYAPEHVAMVRQAGFRAAVTTNWGVSARGTDVFELPRFTPWRSGTAHFLAHMAQNARRVVRHAEG